MFPSDKTNAVVFNAEDELTDADVLELMVQCIQNEDALRFVKISDDLWLKVYTGQMTEEEARAEQIRLDKEQENEEDLG